MTKSTALEPGFTNSTKRFVTRAEAEEIAQQAKQLKDLSPEHTTQALN